MDDGNKVTVNVVVSFTVDATEWADDFGLSVQEAAADFSHYLTRNVVDGSLAAGLKAAWPAFSYTEVKATVAEEADRMTRD